MEAIYYFGNVRSSAGRKAIYSVFMYRGRFMFPSVQTPFGQDMGIRKYQRYNR